MGDFTVWDMLGMVGVLLVLGLYAQLQLGRMSGDDLKFSAGNAVGSLFIAISLLFSFNLSSFVIEISWLFISLIGIYRGLSARGKALAETAVPNK